MAARPCHAASGHACVSDSRGARCLRRSAGFARGLDLPPVAQRHVRLWAGLACGATLRPPRAGYACLRRNTGNRPW
eukprot:10370933-Alexandrium_andersonii.AAC.1